MHKKLQKMQNTCALIHNNALYIYIHPLHQLNQLKMHKKLQIERCVCVYALALCLLLALFLALHCMHACMLLGWLTTAATPPTKNGHAPPPTESRKSFQSVNPSGVRAWCEISRVESN